MKEGASELTKALVGPEIGAKITAYRDAVAAWAVGGVLGLATQMEIARAELESVIADGLADSASDAFNEGVESSYDR